ncbi:MAG: ABC transporter permease subunit [Streptosporangiales bacterium]|nr:ABC transporter permease subunit [Streptosporangiales bacterium]
MNARRPWWASGLMYAALALYMVYLAFPLVWMLSTSFKPAPEISALVPSLLPDDPTLGNYLSAFEQQNIARSALNSLQISIITAVVSVLIALPAAYAVARIRSRLNKAVIGWVLLSQMFPLILILVPLFLLLRYIHLANTHLGLIIVYVVWSLPFSLWLLQGHIKAIPVEVEEAAAVDGASRLRIIKDVVAPLLIPGLIATVMFAFIQAWNEFFFALAVLKDPELATLSITLAKFTGVDGTAQWGPLAASCFLATLPSLALFALIQRRLTSGLLSGAVKS